MGFQISTLSFPQADTEVAVAENTGVAAAGMADVTTEVAVTEVAADAEVVAMVVEVMIVITKEEVTIDVIRIAAVDRTTGGVITSR